MLKYKYKKIYSSDCNVNNLHGLREEEGTTGTHKGPLQGNRLLHMNVKQPKTYC